MYDLKNEIGVKSYSFRSFPENAEVASIAKRCGVSAVDLSGSHIDYDAPAAWAGIIESYRAAGVRLCGIGVVMAKPDEKWNRRFFDFARMAGSGLVSFTFDPAEHEVTMRIMERLSDEYGIRTAIHNHGGYNWLGNRTILGYVFNRCSRSIGLCMDTAWCLQAAEDPCNWLELFGRRLYGLHFKDFEFDRKGKRKDVVVGEGALDLPAFLERLKGLDFNGSAVVEFEGPEPVENTAASVAKIRALL